MARLGLIIDDDTPSRLMYTNMLRGLGLQTLEAGDGIQALDILQAQALDIVFLDLLLPRKNGIELLEYIYSAPHLTHTHVIVITAHNNYKYDLQLRPGDHFFLKPVALGDIREAIAVMLQNEPN